MLGKENGFTLVELIVTIVVFGLVSASVSQLYISIQRSQVATSYLESATRAAQREIETLRNHNYNNLMPGEDIDFSSDLPDNLPDDSTGTVEVSEPTPGIRRVDVSIVYSHNGNDRTVKLSSLIGVIGLTQ